MIQGCFVVDAHHDCAASESCALVLFFLQLVFSSTCLGLIVYTVQLCCLCFVDSEPENRKSVLENSFNGGEWAADQGA